VSLRASSACFALLLLVIGCTNQPQARIVVTATPTQRVQPSPVPTMAQDADDVAASFLDNVLNVIDEASAMAEASCDDLKLAQQDNPNVFRSVRGFAQTLKGVAAQRPDLTDDETIKSTLDELDTTMGELDGALKLCGINPNQ
jgi:hypothetical protein